jgi:glutathione peroxidase
MFKYFRKIFALLCSTTALVSAQVRSPLDFKMVNIDGDSVDLGQYKGKVVLIVNVASKCGFTPQYTELEALYQKYKDAGFVILGFPANNFLGQEPGTNEQIKEFCTLNYGVTFPMFSKISVKGKDQHPLYQYLTDESKHAFGGDIGWNFTKFLIGKDGQIKARFASKTKPLNKKIVTAIEKELSL